MSWKNHYKNKSWKKSAQINKKIERAYFKNLRRQNKKEVAIGFKSTGLKNIELVPSFSLSFSPGKNRFLMIMLFFAILLIETRANEVEENFHIFQTTEDPEIKRDSGISTIRALRKPALSEQIDRARGEEIFATVMNEMREDWIERIDLNQELEKQVRRASLKKYAASGAAAVTTGAVAAAGFFGARAHIKKRRTEKAGLAHQIKFTEKAILDFFEVFSECEILITKFNKKANKIYFKVSLDPKKAFTFEGNIYSLSNKNKFISFLIKEFMKFFDSTINKEEDGKQVVLNIDMNYPFSWGLKNMQKLFDNITQYIIQHSPEYKKEREMNRKREIKASLLAVKLDIEKKRKEIVTAGMELKEVIGLYSENFEGIVETYTDKLETNQVKQLEKLENFATKITSLEHLYEPDKLEELKDKLLVFSVDCKKFSEGFLADFRSIISKRCHQIQFNLQECFVTQLETFKKSYAELPDPSKELSSIYNEIHSLIPQFGRLKPIQQLPTMELLEQGLNLIRKESQSIPSASSGLM